MADAHAKGDAGHGKGGGHKGHKKHHPHAHAEHEHEEGWIVSFADNVLLQMGFFVILLAMNIGPKGASAAEQAAAEERFADFAIAVRQAFNSPVDMGSSDPLDQPLIKRILERQKEHDPEGRGVTGKDRSAQFVRPSDSARIGGFVTFATGADELAPGEAEKARRIAQEYAGTKWVVEVRGHASSAETFRDVQRGRDLGYRRAMALARVLVGAGLDWRQIRIVSVGDADPSVPRASRPDGHASNQRAEVVVLNETAPPDPFSSEGRRAGER